MKDKSKIGLEYETEDGTLIIDQVGILYNFSNLRFMMFKGVLELFGDLKGKTKFITYNVYKIKEEN